MTRHVLYSEDAGIFLGHSVHDPLGREYGSWSKWNPDKNTAAVTFPSENVATGYMEHRIHPFDMHAIPIECVSHYATIEECVAAGLPAWGTE